MTSAIPGTPIPTPTRALLLALGAAITCAAAEGVPYDLGKETYTTETLFSYDGCMDHRLMGNSGQPKVFKNHVYLPLVVHGRRVRILQVPLNGGDAKIGRLDPDYVISEDSHRYFVLDVDTSGYIHLTGGMHGGNWRYWVSARPEDVSAFVPAFTDQGSKESEPGSAPAVSGMRGPPGYGITYPHFNKDAAGNLFLSARGSAPDFRVEDGKKIVHVGLLSTYDAEKRTWRLLGADIPKEAGGKPGHPVTVWGDNFENGPAGGGWYVINTAQFVPAPDNTLHFCFSILNYSSPTGRMSDIEDGSKHAAGKDVLYAVSKDGGRTLQRANGAKVEWPVQAEAGPHQPDVVYAATGHFMAGGNGGSFSGLPGARIQLDWKNRPMIRMHKAATGENVAFRLEHGTWAPCPAEAFGPWRDKAGVLMDRVEKRSGSVVRRWDGEHFRVVELGKPEIEKLDEDYLRDTGTMIYTTKKAGNSAINVMRTIIHRPGDAPSGK